MFPLLVIREGKGSLVINFLYVKRGGGSRLPLSWGGKENPPPSTLASICTPIQAEEKKVAVPEGALLSSIPMTFGKKSASPAHNHKKKNLPPHVKIHQQRRVFAVVI